MRPEDALSTAGVLNGDTLHLAVTQPNTQPESPDLRNPDAERRLHIIQHAFRGVSPAPELMWQRLQIADVGASSNAAMLERENASMLLMLGTPHGIPLRYRRQ
jgi:hypothetical protein